MERDHRYHQTAFAEQQGPFQQELIMWSQVTRVHGREPRVRICEVTLSAYCLNPALKLLTEQKSLEKMSDFWDCLGDVFMRLSFLK